MSPTSLPGVAVIFSTPVTRAKRPRPAPMKSRAPCTAAEPDAQAFSNRVIGRKRISGTCCSTSDAGKSCFEKPLLNRLTKLASTSVAAIPASSIAARATRPISDSMSGSSSLPNGECAQPTMHASVMTVAPDLLPARWWRPGVIAMGRTRSPGRPPVRAVSRHALRQRPAVHLGRAVIDAERAHLAEDSLHQRLASDALAAQHLHAAIHHAPDRLGAEHLRDRGFRGAPRALVQHPGGVPDRQAAHAD